MAIRIDTGHTHGLVRMTDVVFNHRHLVLAISDRAIVPPNGNHVHRVRSLTTFDHRHAHAVDRYTGPAINIPGTGMHYHIIRARTSRNMEHRHILYGRTRRAPNVPARIRREAMRMQYS